MTSSLGNHTCQQSRCLRVGHIITHHQFACNAWPLTNCSEWISVEVVQSSLFKIKNNNKCQISAVSMVEDNNLKNFYHLIKRWLEYKLIEIHYIYRRNSPLHECPDHLIGQQRLWFQHVTVKFSRTPCIHHPTSSRVWDLCQYLVIGLQILQNELYA